jgi:hypothetical protein
MIRIMGLAGNAPVQVRKVVTLAGPYPNLMLSHAMVSRSSARILGDLAVMPGPLRPAGLRRR